MNDIIHISEAFLEKPLEQLYPHRDAHSDQDGLPAFEFPKGKAEGKTNGDKHHHVHDDFRERQHFALPNKPIVPQRMVPVARHGAHGSPEKHCRTKQNHNKKRQKQPCGHPQAFVSAFLYECDGAAYDENS